MSLYIRYTPSTHSKRAISFPFRPLQKDWRIDNYYYIITLHNHHYIIIFIIIIIITG